MTFSCPVSLLTNPESTEHTHSYTQCTHRQRVPTVSANTAGVTEAAIGAIGALMNIVLQPLPLFVLGLNVWMGTAAGADELVELRTD